MDHFRQVSCVCFTMVEGEGCQGDGNRAQSFWSFSRITATFLYLTINQYDSKIPWCISEEIMRWIPAYGTGIFFDLMVSSDVLSSKLYILHNFWIGWDQQGILRLIFNLNVWYCDYVERFLYANNSPLCGVERAWYWILSQQYLNPVT